MSEGQRFTETLNIYPSGKIHTHLNSVRDGDSLRAARDQNGQPVVSSSTDQGSSDTVAQYVSTVHDKASDDYPPGKDGHVFVAVENPSSPSSLGVKHTMTLPLSKPKVPSGFIMGMRIVKGRWAPFDAKEAQKNLQALPKSSFSSIGDWFGDIINHIENAIDDAIDAIKDTVVELADGVSFFIHEVDSALEFVATLYGQVLKLAMQTLIQVFKVINTLLKLVGIDLSAVRIELSYFLAYLTSFPDPEMAGTSIWLGQDMGYSQAHCSVNEK